MKITISQPKDFDYGVWKILVILEPFERELTKDDIFFDIPKVSDRFFRPYDDFCSYEVSSPSYPFRGKFCDGEWQGIVQAHGMSEEKCNSSLEEIELAIERSINCSLFPERA